MGMTLIEEIDAGGVASFSFTGIPQDHLDLLVVVSARNQYSTNTLNCYLNADTNNSNYQTQYLGINSGNSPEAGNYAGRPYTFINNSTDASAIFSNTKIYISDYATSDNKMMSIDTTAPTDNDYQDAKRYILSSSYLTTSPITSILFSNNSNPLLAGSTASLYAITAD